MASQPTLAEDFNPAANYDEVAVNAYMLPDPLSSADGARVSTSRMWWDQRRPQILRLFEDNVFGGSPKPPTGMKTRLSSEASGVFGGLAIRREVEIEVTPGAPPINLLIYLPAGHSAAVPAILGLNFHGNHTVSTDPGVRIVEIDMDGMDIRTPDQPTGAAAVGMQADRWQVETILRRGYALATFYYGDVFPDRPSGARQSIQPFVDPGRAYGWGALATWAWSLSRALDYLMHVPEIDAGHVAVVGHSRLGKAALWAGATDERFALVISNNSGAGGASLARRNFGETVRHLVTRFPHWFATGYAEYAGHEDRLPIDQHMLLALSAPRPLYVASAADDLWADPKGEFLSALAADPVYRLLGTSGLPAVRAARAGEARDGNDRLSHPRRRPWRHGL